MSKQIASASPKSRERLLEAAVDVFGKHGFEAATTRMIANEASVNIAAIPYYFNGKEGLYQAAVTHIVEKIETRAAATFREMGELASRQNLDRDGALDALETLLEAMVNFMVGLPEAPRVARIILREQIDPSSAYDIVFTRIMAPLINTIAALVAATGKNITPRMARLRAAAIMGQVIVFRVGKETMVRLNGMEGYSPKETEEVRKVVLEHTRAVIKAGMLER